MMEAERDEVSEGVGDVEMSNLIEENVRYQLIDHMVSFVGAHTPHSTNASSSAPSPSPSHEGPGVVTFKFVCLLLGPILTIPFLANVLDASQRINRCAGVTCWMAVWWMSEALPISFTALLPLVIFPLFGVVGPEAVAESYFNDLSFLFIGTVFFACAMERWSFHKRFALKVLLVVGTNPGAVLIGFMFCTYFLSWWLSNSATAALMLPVVRAVLENLGDENNSSENGSNSGLEHRKFSKAALIAVSYSASIGGISTLTGTGTNLVFAGQVRDLFPNYGDLSFAQWMLYAAPMSLVLLGMMWLLFYYQYLRKSTHRIDTHTVKQRYQDLGKISFEELVVMCLLIFTVILWLSREPPGCSDCGWQALFKPYLSWYNSKKEPVSDGTVVLFTGFLMFMVPARNRTVGRRILEWEYVIKKLPWDVLLLLGGGFALSKAFSATQFTDYIAIKLSGLSSLPPYLAVLLLCAIVSVLTEFTSNAAVASIMLPIVASTAVAMRINPLFLMVPVCITCSFAFCLPVATPSNAMVFGMGLVNIRDLVKSGLWLNIIGLLLNVAWMAMAGKILDIDLHHFPAWADT